MRRSNSTIELRYNSQLTNQFLKQHLLCFSTIILSFLLHSYFPFIQSLQSNSLQVERINRTEINFTQTNSTKHLPQTTNNESTCQFRDQYRMMTSNNNRHCQLHYHL
ncbi:hypothetical protein SNEBB_010340 [Seison nebaliae]|nr:hypothetical protein SNEBB_010340 [Seison nebaliae]